MSLKALISSRSQVRHRTCNLILLILLNFVLSSLVRYSESLVCKDSAGAPQFHYNSRIPLRDNKRKNIRFSVEPRPRHNLPEFERNFICSSTTPIQIVFDLRKPHAIIPTSNHFESGIHADNSNSSTNRENYSPQKRYSIEFGLFYGRKNNFTISCEPVELISLCQKTVLHFQVMNRRNQMMYFLKSTDSRMLSLEASGEIPSSNLIIDDPLVSKECPLYLQIKQRGHNSLLYRWTHRTAGGMITEPSEGSIIHKTYTTNTTLTYYNLYRSIPTRGNCVKLLSQDELCAKCQLVFNYTINSVIFYAETTDKSYKAVYRGLFTVTSVQDGPRSFFIDLARKKTEAKEMMTMSHIPSILYTDRILTVNCYVSTFLFAHGATLMLDQEEQTQKEDDHLELWSNYGARILTRKFSFPTGNESHTIYCKAPYWSSNTSKTISQQVMIEDPIKPVVKIESEETILVTDEMVSNFELKCTVTAKPFNFSTDLQWIQPCNRCRNEKVWEILKPMENRSNHVLYLRFEKLERKHSGRYTCRAKNYLGQDEKSVSLVFPALGLSKKSKVTISTSFGGLIIAICFTIGILVRKINLQRKKYKEETWKAIKEFKEGLSKAELKTIMLESHSSHHILNQKAMEMSYKPDYEVPVTRWILEDEILGSGQFGIVKKGVVNTGYSCHQVAVKLMKENAGIDEFRNFLSELKIMSHIGNHVNIVSLIACCMDNIDQRVVMIGVELCSNGSLLTYLKKNKGSFKNYVHCGEINQEILMKSTRYANRIETFSTLDLYKWAFQIANGMEFLESKQILHGDLAARNVLLTSDKVAKISDFGLSRIMISGRYTKQSECPLPWKWMAVESLHSFEFSTKSDVWSYGVTLWEMFSLGATPWPGMHWSDEFLEQLENGLRMNRPPNATENFYALMLSCWNYEPEDRMNFTEIRPYLAKFMESLEKLKHGEEAVNILKSF